MRRLMMSVLTVAGLGIAGLYTLKRWQTTTYPLVETLILKPELLDESYEGRTRLLRLKGAVNLRDLGGYVTSDDKRVKWGKVYRSGSLGKLSNEDLEEIEKLGIQLVCDLRQDREVALEPDLLPESVIYWHHPVDTDDQARSRRRMGALFFNPRHLSVLMLETYTEVMLDRNAKLFAELLTRLSQPENLPALFHCTAGKDRTGIAAMLLLLVLGVPEETIIADYTLSNLYYQEYLAYANQVIERYRWLGLRGERMYPLLIADAKTIKSAIDYLHNRYGTVENYLYTAGEIDKDVISRLRENLLEEIV